MNIFNILKDLINKKRVTCESMEDMGLNIEEMFSLGFKVDVFTYDFYLLEDGVRLVSKYNFPYYCYKCGKITFKTYVPRDSKKESLEDFNARQEKVLCILCNGETQQLQLSDKPGWLNE